MVARILVGLGGTSFTPIAIRYAVEIARNHRAEVHGITVTDHRRLIAFMDSSPQDAAVEMSYLKDLEVRQEQSVEELTTACTDSEIGLQITRESGNPFDLMISQARYHDLMIFGLRSLFEGHVVKTGPSEVLTRLVSKGVRPILAVSKEYRPIRRVMLAYSGSMESAKAIRRFTQLKLWPDVSVKIVTFEEKHLANGLLTDMAAYCKSHGYEAEVEWFSGSPHQRLLEEANDWGADLIVVGNSARSLWRKKLFGETAMHLIKHANIPLFLSQ